MRYRPTHLLAIFALVFLTTQLQAQKKVIGFFPNWRSGGEENNIQYNKITDIIYCFIQPNSSGQFPALSGWPASDQSKFNIIKTNAKAAGCRVRISSGGAGSASLYSPIAANATYRNNFAQTVADFIVTNNIDGFDVDWEFPSTSEKGNLDLLLSAFRTAFNAKESAGYRHIYLGVDVGGESGHLSYFTNTFVNYIDDVNIMAYDLSGGFSTVTLAKNSFDIWKNYLGAANASKLILGIPFYTAGGSQMYSQLASPYASNAANAYNGTLSGSDGSTYNAAPAIKQKIDYVMANGGGGVLIWELTQDILSSSYYQYSLLTGVDVAIKPYQSSCSAPNLGSDATLCGAGSLTLNSSLTAQSYRTFTWYKDGAVTGGNTATLTNVTAGGKYWVKVDSSGKCNKVDTINISATLPNVDLGPDITFCATTSATLDAGISGSGLTYAWTLNGSTISGATSKTYIASQAGTYAVTVSASGCTSKTDQLLINSNLLNISGTTTICTGASTTLTVTSAGGPFSWYTVPTNGTSVNTGTSYTVTPGTTTTYYVQNGAGTAGSVGGTGSFGTTQWSDPTGQGITFTTNVASVTIKSVDLYIGAWGLINNAVIGIKNSSGTDLGVSAPVSYDNTGGGSLYKLTANLNVTIPNAGSGYVLYFKSCGASGSTAYQTTPGTFPMTEGTNTIKLTAGPQVFNNIQFVAGSACARTPVTVNVNGCGGSAPNITYSDITKTYGNAPFLMTASSPSGGAMTYSITSGSAYASINSTSGQVTILGAGTVTVQVSQAANGSYAAGTKSATLTINKAALSATADAKSKVFNTANPALTITYSGFVNSETSSVLTTLPTVSTIATTTSNVGVYPITLTGGASANYNITLVNGNLTITQATPTLTYTGPTSGNAGSNITLAATTTGTGTPAFSEANGTGTATLSGSTLTLNTAGNVTVTITVAANGNYSSATITQTITINALNAPTITYNSLTKVYGDVPFLMTASSPSGGAMTYSITAGGTLATINSTTGQVTIKGAGTVTVQVSQAANGSYAAATKTATLTINKATLTATADSKTKVYNTANPALTFTYSGFVNSETSSVVLTAPTASTAATISSNVGSYAITVSGGAATNYNFNYVAGTLTITKANPTLTYTGATSGAAGSNITVASSTNSDATPTYGLTNGSGTGSLSGTILTLNSVGTLTLTVSVAATTNYNANSVSQTITINTLPSPTVTINFSTSGRVGDVISLGVTTNSTGAVTYSVSNGTGLASLSGNQLTLTSAGTVTVTVDIAGDGTYAPATVTKTITITSTTAVIGSAESGFRVYPSITESYSLLEIKNLNVSEGVIKISDMRGIEINSMEYHGESEFKIDASTWPSGVYVIKLLTNNGDNITKLVKQ